METRPIWVKYIDLTIHQKEWLNECSAKWPNGKNFNFLNIDDGAILFEKKTLFYFRDSIYILNEYHFCKTGKEFCKLISNELNENFYTGIFIKPNALLKPHKEWLEKNHIQFCSEKLFNSTQELDCEYLVFDGLEKNKLSFAYGIPDDIYTEYFNGTEFCQAIAEKLNISDRKLINISFSKMEVIDLNLFIPIENKPSVPKEQKFWVAWHPLFGFDLRYFSKISFPKKDL